MPNDSMTAPQLDVDDDQDEGPEHPQVHIRHGRQSADVDEGMAPLILACWRAGIATLHSCQDTPVQVQSNDGDYVDAVGTWCYVHFPAIDAEKFLRRIVRDSDDELTEHAVGVDPDRWDEMTDEQCEAFEFAHQWQWGAGAHAADYDQARPWIGVTVHFPIADLPEILRRLAH